MDLTRQVHAETVVRFLVDELEAGGEVDTAGGHQWMVGPELDPLVAGPAGEVDALPYQARAEPVTPRGRVDEEDPQLRGRLVGTRTEHTAHPAAVQFGDPRGLPPRIAALREVGDDACYQRLEAAVSAELRLVEGQTRYSRKG